MLVPGRSLAAAIDMSLLVKLASSLRDVVYRSTQHWLSAIGALLTTVSAFAFIAMFGIELSGKDFGPYTGIISYLLLPMVFIGGLLLIPVGLLLLRRRERLGKPAGFPVVDFNLPRTRTIALAVVIFTALNLMVVSSATYKGMEVMHSDPFCGGACHSVMQPQQVAHLMTAHANVKCTDCHVGEGATHFVKSKLRGMGQLWQLVRNDIQRPPEQPTEVPQVNCNNCHANEKFTEDHLRIARHYSDDEKVVETTSVWRMRIGGFRDGKWTGIHKHNGMKISYLSDKTRQTISAVKVLRPDGTSSFFDTKDTAHLQGAEWHDMGCVDCHNRQGHNFVPADKIVDEALGRGAIDKGLPFIRKAAVAALSKGYASNEEGVKQIPVELEKFYADAGIDPTKDQLKTVSDVLAPEWSRSNFPGMGITGSTFRNYLQHDPGCYRCHDNGHVDEKGASIQKKCSGTCHDVIADHEQSPEAMDVLFP